jgi:hypothetical protein
MDRSVDSDVPEARMSDSDSTATVVATVVSAVIGGISAVVAAISAVAARDSARASRDALHETRRQYEITDARAELAELGGIYDQAMAFAEHLAADYLQNPALVAQRREALMRAMMVAGVTTPALGELASSDRPVTRDTIARVRAELTAESTRRHLVITGTIGSAHDT